MRPRAILGAIGLALALLGGGCDDAPDAAAPPPRALTAAATGHYCNMNVLEHAGPKGQILLRGRAEPVWFTSARDTLAFTMLPEEPKDVLAVYVSDMGRAPDWERPGAENWVDARKALYVIGSDRRGGMGAEEAVPFAERAAAERFVAENGGRVVAFGEVPRDYVLGGATADAPPPPPAPAGSAPAHRH